MTTEVYRGNRPWAFRPSCSGPGSKVDEAATAKPGCIPGVDALIPGSAATFGRWEQPGSARILRAQLLSLAPSVVLACWKAVTKMSARSLSAQSVRENPRPSRS